MRTKRVIERLRATLGQILEDPEHGVPVPVLERLEALEGELERLSDAQEAASGISRIRGDLEAFREGVEGVLHGDPDAADKLLTRGFRIVELLGSR